jgi:hypothetical protein
VVKEVKAWRKANGKPGFRENLRETALKIDSSAGFLFRLFFA